MNVKLTAITQPLILTEDKNRNLTAEEYITYCARVSNPTNQLNTETSAKLLAYCIKHKHWSIFEQVDLTFEIKTSRAIAAQILRHKSSSFQEFSQRYAEITNFEPIELRKQGKTNRQVGEEVYFNKNLEQKIQEHIDKSKILYDELIKDGIAKESARFILPLATETTMYMKNNIRGWIHYLELRTSEHTQKEHRLIALRIREIFIQNFRNIGLALNWN